jgi:NAD(P)H-quinone oxidoreductase subunit 5
MLTQTDIKRKLAWSTISQMGFMMLQCGLGAFAVATLHIVGHSFYKGYGFLSAASTVDPHEPQPGDHPAQAEPLHPVAVGAALVLGVVVVTAVAMLLQVSAAHKPGLPVLGAILAMAVAQTLLTERQTGTASVRRLGAAVRDGAGITVAYFLLAALFEHILTGAVPPGGWQPTAGAVALTVLVAVLFFGAFTMQTRLPQIAASATGRRLYVHAYNGFYLGALQNRLVQRLWPVSGA